MGVTILTENDELSVSMPCSTLFEFKIDLITIYIDYIRSSFDETLPRLDENEEYTKAGEAFAMIDTLQKYVNLIKSARLTTTNNFLEVLQWRKQAEQYLFVAKTLGFFVPGGAGLIKFVEHSDCEGCHSPGDAHDISNAWNLLNADKLEDHHQEIYKKLSAIWIRAANTSQNVLYR